MLVRLAGGIANFTYGFQDGNMKAFMDSCSKLKFVHPESTPAVMWQLGRRVWPVENIDDGQNQNSFFQWLCFSVSYFIPTLTPNLRALPCFRPGENRGRMCRSQRPTQDRRPIS